MKPRRLPLLGVLLAAAAFAAEPLPGESLYQLPLRLTLQDGSSLPLAGLRGSPTVITMFYASCDGVCPAIAFSMRRMEKSLDAAQRARMQWLMVSFDPARDNVEALRTFATDNNLDTGRWRLARAETSGVRDLAAALNIRYRELENGVFSHSTEIVLLDADGVIRARTSNLTSLDPEFRRAIAAQLERQR
ncbi:MAG: SCO family protein [Pseudomonadota bacterium]